MITLVPTYDTSLIPIGKKNRKREDNSQQMLSDDTPNSIKSCCKYDFLFILICYVNYVKAGLWQHCCNLVKLTL